MAEMYPSVRQLNLENWKTTLNPTVLSVVPQLLKRQLKPIMCYQIHKAMLCSDTENIAMLSEQYLKQNMQP